MIDRTYDFGDSNAVKVKMTGSNSGNHYTWKIDVEVHNSSDHSVIVDKIQIHMRAGDTPVYYPGQNPQVRRNTSSASLEWTNTGPNDLQGGVVVENESDRLNLDGSELRISAS